VVHPPHDLPVLQDPPRASNRFRTDRAFRRVLERVLGPDLLAEAGPELDEMGERACAELPALQDRAESNPPRLVPFDAWGRRVDRIEVDPAWLELVRIGQEAGVVATAYEDRFGTARRVVQFALLHLFNPVSATADCPLSMSDGAARVLSEHDPDLAARYVPRLTARRDAWTSGQWMTEATGGSDVSRTATVARPDGAGGWRLSGTKWFTSATTADIALALARPEGAEPGSGGLSLFLLELRRPDGSWNGLRVRRLKDKLGTRALPTAELDLDGTAAVPVGGLGRGVAKVAAMLNVTRLHAAFGGLAQLGHGLDLARDHARRREAFGRPVAELPIHRAWIARVAAEYEAMLALAFRAAELVGRAEAGADPGAGDLARVAVPLTKVAVARRSVWAASELLESFGGAGYLEDTGIPRILRDAHVQPIWEGTTSVMAHDVLRALRNEGIAQAFLAEVDERVRAATHPATEGPAGAVLEAVGRLRPMLAEPEEGAGRRLAWGMARTYEAALLCEAAARALRDHGDGRTETALRLLAEPLVEEDPGPTPDDLAALAFP
jgi:alkylation response protein AidB-like acyl-CoA dehydrogenase